MGGSLLCVCAWLRYGKGKGGVDVGLRMVTGVGRLGPRELRGLGFFDICRREIGICGIGMGNGGCDAAAYRYELHS